MPLPVVVATLCDPSFSWEAVVVVVAAADVAPVEDTTVDALVLCKAIMAVAVGIKCLMGGGVKVP